MRSVASGPFRKQSVSLLLLWSSEHWRGLEAVEPRDIILCAVFTLKFSYFESPKWSSDDYKSSAVSKSLSVAHYTAHMHI